MKTRIILIVSALALTGLLHYAAGQSYREKIYNQEVQSGKFSEMERIVKRYKVNRDTKVELQNKYGAVHIDSWEKDSMNVIIWIKYNSRDQKHLEKLKDNFSFDFVETNHFIVLKTIFSGSSNLFSDLKSLVSSTPENAVTIDYEITMPSYLAVSIENKFGDTYLPDLTGSLKLDLSYGKLLANNLSGETNIELKSYDTHINEITKGNLVISDSEVDIDNAGTLVVESRSSDLDISDVDDILLLSRGDEIKITNAGVLDIKNNYSDIEIWEIKSSLYFNSNYGSMRVYLSDNRFETINIQSRFTDVAFNFLSDKICFNTEIVHQKARLMYPAGMTSFKEEELNKKEARYKTYGKYGQCPSAEKKLIIKFDSGELKFLGR